MLLRPLLLLFFLALPAFADEPSLSGHWAGDLVLGPARIPVHASLHADGGRFDFPPDFLGLPITRLEQKGGHVHVEAAQHLLRFAFDGTLSKDELKGEFTGIAAGTFHFRRIPVAQVPLDPFIGLYKEGEVRRQGSRLFLDAERPIPVFPVSAEEAVYAEEGVLHHLTGKPQPPPFATREIGFSGPKGRLSATLTLPPGKGPFPAVAFVHGSGPHTRGFFLALSRLYARHGFASLAWDKPGTGDSEGAYGDDLAAYAQDARAALAALRKAPEVDPERLGFWGISQAGWIIAKAAGREPDLAFSVLVACCAEPTADQDRTRIRHTLRAEGFPEEAVRKAVETTDRLKAAALQGRKMEEVEGIGPEMEKEAWWASAYQGAPLAQVYGLFRTPGGAGDYDPAQDLGRMACRTLVVMGGKDEACPADVNRPLYEKAFAGRKDVSYLVFPENTHGLPTPEQEGRILAWIRGEGK